MARVPSATSSWRCWRPVLLLGRGGEGGTGGGPRQGLAGDLTSHGWGGWLVGAIGVGMVGRGLWQFVKACTERYPEKIRSFDLGPARSEWVLVASRLGLTARGVIFGLIGGYFI